jgi:hypothetical protein
MAKWACRLIAVYVIGIAILVLTTVAMNWKGASYPSGHNLRPALIPSILLLGIGIGLFLCHRWAVISTIVLCVGGGVVWLYAALFSREVHAAPFWVGCVNVLMALIVMCPGIILIKFWPKLRALRRKADSSAALRMTN